MPLKNLKDFTDLLVPLQEAYGQLETEYELQRAMLHEKAAENAKLREALSFLLGQFQSEPKMDGNHYYRFTNSGWPMTHFRGPNVEMALTNAMAEVCRNNEDGENKR